MQKRHLPPWKTPDALCRRWGPVPGGKPGRVPKRWFWKYRKDGKEGRMSLGSHPEVSLRAARLARDAAKLQKSDGRDPVQARKVEKLKASNPTGDTFKAVALEWYAKQAPHWSPAHADRSLRQLERDLFPWLGERRLKEIEPVELLATLRKWRSAAQWRRPTGV
jgi:hypothetical protein